jgi:glucose/arabinose dehydrogenase
LVNESPVRSVSRLVVFCVAILALAISANAATLPAGFTETALASGLVSPTAMQIAPDGRIFVAEQTGRLRIIRNGTLLPTPFVTLNVDPEGERGLLGVAFDPNFAVNQYVYVYYTAAEPVVRNRISRLTANGDQAVPGSEVILLQTELRSATNHMGGAMAFGADGKLYVALGDNSDSANAQSLSNVHGKMLRLNTDGTIPTDNPFYGVTTGMNRAIWALGLRNPFTFDFNDTNGDMFINDVGQQAWEEINRGVRGGNYGWPSTEGSTSNPNFVSPIYAYDHEEDRCAITGGAFYTPASTQFPSNFFGDYFFADYCAGWIRQLASEAGNPVTTFATAISAPVDLKVGNDGSLYYLARGFGANTGVLYRVDYTGSTVPRITTQPVSQTVAPGATVTFTVGASGQTPLAYQWQRNASNIPGATAASYALSATQADSGSRFRAIVTNSSGSATSDEATLTVTGNLGPTATITQPVVGSLYSGGSTITVAGTGTDSEGGTLPASVFTWRVDFHHDDHTHPFIPNTTGIRSGSFSIPTTGETSANVYYRIYLTVRDTNGLTSTVTRDVLPRTIQLSLAASTPGLQLQLDGQPVMTPHTVTAVVGISRTIAAPSPQTLGAATYTFGSWSDGGAATHAITTPATNSTYTASYTSTGGGGGGGGGGSANGLAATYYNNQNLTGTTFSRVDPAVDFSWNGSPATGIAGDTFSVRWTGQVLAQYSETYTFLTQCFDGVRLWVNGQLLVNNWTNHAMTLNSGSIALTAGQRYTIQMEFYDATGSAVARLGWSSRSTPVTVIPSSRLFH